MRNFIDSTFFSFLFPLALIGMILLGYYLTSVYVKKKKQSWVNSGAEASVISFFALLISFTLLTSNNEYRKRLAFVHEESDQLAQLRRESLLMGKEAKDQVQQFLTAYLPIQIDYGHERINNEAWKTSTEAVCGKFLDFITRHTDSSALTVKQQDILLQKFNKISSVFYQTQYSYTERTPNSIMLLLIISALLVAVLVGFMNGFKEKRHYLVPFIYVTMVAMTLQSIRDLDDPLHGSIRPSLDNLESLYSMLQGSKR